MKGSSFTTGHEPLERTKQLITLMVKAISPKVCPEICRKHREWRKKKKKHKNLSSGHQLSAIK